MIVSLSIASHSRIIAIATITVGVLGAVLGVLSGRLSEPAAHDVSPMAAVEAGTARFAEGVARIEQLIETTGAGVSRLEVKIDYLLQLHLRQDRPN